MWQAKLRYPGVLHGDQGALGETLLELLDIESHRVKRQRWELCDESSSVADALRARKLSRMMEMDERHAQIVAVNAVTVEAQKNNLQLDETKQKASG